MKKAFGGTLVKAPFIFLYSNILPSLRVVLNLTRMF